MPANCSKRLQNLPQSIISDINESHIITTLPVLRTLYDPARERSVLKELPSMGEMLRDQTADRMAPGTVFETQEQMLERYKQTL